MSDRVVIGNVGDPRRVTVEPFRDTYVVECWENEDRLHCLPARTKAEALVIARTWMRGGEVPND